MGVARAATTVLLMLVLVACSTVRESEPGRTATEQLIFSTAIDRVCDQLALDLPAGSKVFVDASYVEGTDSKYLVASLRDRILRHGGQLVAARDQADLLFEPRVGALSIDRKKTLVGVPSIPLPIPLTSEVSLPELALFKRDRRQGVVKLALTSYDARTGELHSAQEPIYAFSHQTEWVALLFISWDSNDLMPNPRTTTGSAKAPSRVPCRVSPAIPGSPAADPQKRARPIPAAPVRDLR